ncbi:MAG: class I SAM-dependent methyltransferase [Deltaproteobacteria bacterium]|nr:class I SAM-dependent methyltransferase [Deltaproteobacteria bacterium]
MKRSLLAGVNALYRAAESARVQKGRILTDPYADALSERSLRINLIRYGRFALPMLWRTIDELQTAHCVRHRAVDELILNAVEKNGVEQVVILGAGYDMRPYRFAGRLNAVKWIEIDHPTTLSAKLALLGKLGMSSAKIQRAGSDLRDCDLVRVLADAAFDPALNTCFVAEGVIHYLALRDFEVLLSTAARGPGKRRFIFSYIDSATYSAASPTLLALVKLVREFPLLHFKGEDLALICEHAGFSGIKIWNFAEQIADFVPQAQTRNIGATQHLAVLTKK